MPGGDIERNVSFDQFERRICCLLVMVGCSMWSTTLWKRGAWITSLLEFVDRPLPAYAIHTEVAFVRALPSWRMQVTYLFELAFLSYSLSCVDAVRISS